MNLIDYFEANLNKKDKKWWINSKNNLEKQKIYTLP